MRRRDFHIVRDPRIRGGRPTIGGVLTEILACRIDAGEAVAEIADDYDLTEAEVREALDFEGKSYA